ncbi:TetR/AcrR family transcriptional regulator [Bogoriella caseilytica]|uniref:TetR family transcriptional regulator n=1 Tax=Bogoriella caseilytica TaxID=56055 RepID=A0A3N2BAU2_9MICO|nr:TetR/AcrR family transcriptional regulator [Bogoriella caseilytica]ROR72379.1 TetR family transcriptional regulator [Bogoriella caseilytica]
MPTRSRGTRDADGRPPTVTEIARRQQILDATIAIIGRAGWSACTLQSVADEIGVTKAAVIYHVGTKAGLVEQAYGFVINEFATFVHESVIAANTPMDSIVAFTQAHLDYMLDHPDHARLIAESVNDAHPTGIEDRPSTPSRTLPLIELIDTARAAGHTHADPAEPAAVVATALTGMIDASVAAWLTDSTFDMTAAGRLIRTCIHATV